MLLTSFALSRHRHLVPPPTAFIEKNYDCANDQASRHTQLDARHSLFPLSSLFVRFGFMLTDTQVEHHESSENDPFLHPSLGAPPSS